jgi:cyclohexyl-isocyanide hydratase
MAHVTGTGQLRIGAFVFDQMDQIDLTGPFEALARLTDSSFSLYGLTDQPVTDMSNLVIQVDGSIDDAPQLDVLHVPGGPGQEALMDDERLMNWLRNQASGARLVFSVCTGALLLGAADLLVGKQATTHWASLELLSYFGATPVDKRVIVDGNYVFTAGVTAGIDGALTVIDQLRGPEEAQLIQLILQYAPEPPFQSGHPSMAPANVLAKAQEFVRELTDIRRVTAEKYAEHAEIPFDR